MSTGNTGTGVVVIGNMLLFTLIWWHWWLVRQQWPVQLLLPALLWITGSGVVAIRNDVAGLLWSVNNQEQYCCELLWSGDNGTCGDKENCCWLCGSGDTGIGVRNTVADSHWSGEIGTGLASDQEHCGWLTLDWQHWNWCVGDQEHCYWLTLVWWH